MLLVEALLDALVDDGTRRNGMYIGAHVKSSGGVWSAVDNGMAVGAEAVQFFAGSPRTWRPMVYKDQDAAQFREARGASPIRFVVIHTIYLINLATTNEDFYEKSVTSLVGAVVAAEQLGADAIVTHVGSHQGAGFAAGLERVRVALGRALEEVGDSKVRVLLENTAGAGGTMGVNFEELGAMIDAVGGDPRVGVCVDTCHLFAAGYDIRTKSGLDEAVAALDDACGIERLALLHLNDSMTPLGSNRDRHDNIGEGHIGIEGFREIVNHPAFDDLPGVLEVPGFDGHGPDLRNVEILRGLAKD
jgi:deoxyribonuclease IV